MECKLIDFDGNMHFQESALVLAPKLSAHSVKSYYLDQFKGLDDLNECVLLFQLKQKDKIIDEHLHFFSPEKELQLSKDYVINTGLNAQPDGSYDIKISADKFVKGVYLSFGDIEGHFSDNYFDLLPGESKLVHFIPKSEVRLNANQLKHICLQDVTP